MRLAHNDRSELSLYRVLTLMATRASQQAIAGPTLTATLRGLPERCWLAYNDCSELSLYRVLSLMATGASQQLIAGLTLTATPRGVF